MEVLNVVLTAILSVITLFIIAKIMGHKQVSQLDFFDYISGITIGSIAAEMATELEAPWKPLIAIIIYGGVSFTLSILMNKLPRSRKYINGAPTIIMDNGKLYRKNMKKAKLDLSEFMVLCRQEGYFHINTIQTAIFEYNGKLTIMPISNQRPVIPADMNIEPKPDSIDVEVIMDGRILDENLTRMGLDKTWLHNQLKSQGFKEVENIYLGLCDSSRNLSVYPVE